MSETGNTSETGKMSETGNMSETEARRGVLATEHHRQSLAYVIGYWTGLRYSAGREIHLNFLKPAAAPRPRSGRA